MPVTKGPEQLRPLPPAPVTSPGVPGVRSLPVPPRSAGPGCCGLEAHVCRAHPGPRPCACRFLPALAPGGPPGATPSRVPSADTIGPGEGLSRHLWCPQAVPGARATCSPSRAPPSDCGASGAGRGRGAEARHAVQMWAARRLARHCGHHASRAGGGSVLSLADPGFAGRLRLHSLLERSGLCRKAARSWQ